MRLALCLLLAASAPLFADGGMVILRGQAPPYAVTVFASPAPPRAGAVDLSVLLQRSDTLDPVLDADVQIEIAKDAAPIRVSATHGRAQNKLLFAATVPLDAPGAWRYTVFVRPRAGSPASVSGEIAVSGEAPRLAAYAGYLALPFVFLALFALNQWLRDRP